MSKGGGSSTTTQKADPWEEQQPYLKDIFGQAQNLYYGNTPEYYPGTTVAAPTEAELQGQKMALATASGFLPGYIDSSVQGQQFLATGDVLTPENNPYLASYAKGAIDPIVENLTQNILPQIGRDEMVMGQYGGSRGDIAEGLAVDRAVEDMANMTSQIYSNAYGQGLNAMTTAQGLAPQYAGMTLMPAEIYSGVGEAQGAYDQAQIDDAMARWNYYEGLPYNQLADYQSIVQGQYGGTSSAQSTQKSGGLFGK